MNVVVVGGGYAGLAAACRLAGDGHRPLLMERSPRLGGRASSFTDPNLGETVDYGHHILMRCCTAATGFLHRIAMDDAVSFQPHLSVPILYRQERSVLRSRFLPGPLHLAPGLLAYRPLTRRQRRSALLAGGRLLLANPRRLEDVSFDAWLAARGQDRGAVERLWDPICIAVLNAPACDVSAAAAHKVFSDGFFRSDGADLGLFTVPLSDIADAAAVYLAAHDGRVRTGIGVDRIALEGDAVAGVVLADGSEIEADTLISAVTPRDLVAMLPAQSGAGPVVQRALDLAWSPIVNIHLWFDRPVMDDPFFVAVDSPIQVVFDVTRLHRSEGPGTARTHVVISQSAAATWMERSDGELIATACDALRTLSSRFGKAERTGARVIRHPLATFLPTPGASCLRPRAVTSIRGLFLAGDWTATGWPSTLEGAVRSGIIAAAYAETAADRPEDGVSNPPTRPIF